MTTHEPTDVAGARSFETVRPTHDPVVEALTAADPALAFVELMRERLGPGEWEFPIGDGFAWIPYRLKHLVECFDDGAGRLVARSTFVLVENADEGEALTMAAYLNQRSFGGAIWYDPEDKTVRLTSVARLDPSTWWNAYLFAATVPRLVGICEHLAPRLATWVSGDVAVATHPFRGARTEPDQFYDEYAIDTYVPEAGAGLWWSAREVAAFREVIGEFVATARGVVEWPPDPVEGVLLFESMRATARVPTDDGWVEVRVGEVDHPDLGLGVQILLTSSVEFTDVEARLAALAAKRLHRLDSEPRGLPPTSPSSLPASRVNTWDSLLLANELNRILAISRPANLTLGGWTVYEGQPHLATYLWPEVIRMFQSAGTPTVGESFGLLVSDVVRGNLQLVPSLLHHESMAGTTWGHVDHSAWRGVNQNAGYKSLLVDQSECVPATIDGLPLNTFLAEPIELDGQMWALQHSQLLMSMGIFNPVGPSIGSLEVAIDHTLRRGMLIERLRHPFSPAVRLWAVIDRQGFDSLDHFADLLIPRLQWNTFDWVRVLAREQFVAEAVDRGLLRFARRDSHNSLEHAQRLADSVSNPWTRLDHDYAPTNSLDDAGRDPAELWLEIVTHPALVDSSLAYLRSAWEGAKAFVDRSDDPTIAQQWITRISNEVTDRRAGLA
ncbi:hypothetical protein OAX95_00715 [bacterium]|nr:hypothetical protein [bacterium]